MNKVLRGLFSILVAAASQTVLADDFGVWTEAGITKKLGNQGFTVSADLGFRANNNLKSVDRWSGTIDFGYKACPYVKFGAGYTLLYNYNPSEKKDWYGKTSGKLKGYKETAAYWRTKHRVFLDVTGMAYLGRFSFSLRERYQMTHQMQMTVDRMEYSCNKDADGNLILPPVSGESSPDLKGQKSKNYLRSRLEVDYNIRHSPFTPYASVEISNNLMNGFSTDKKRLGIGTELKIAQGQRLSLGYVYQFGYDDDSDEDMHVIDISYKFKF
ncbi:MAG: DUF2490 domain-containing protein [Bacteroidaceae bacterium]